MSIHVLLILKKKKNHWWSFIGESYSCQRLCVNIYHIVGPTGLICNEWSTIVHFKHLGSQHIHKEIKLQEAMNRIERILCKTGLIFIRRYLIFKCNTFSDVDFEAFPKSAYVPLCYSQFQ